nr:MAG TPA: hypothetical protein [Caudoviricetes sp.]
MGASKLRKQTTAKRWNRAVLSACCNMGRG